MFHYLSSNYMFFFKLFMSVDFCPVIELDLALQMCKSDHCSSGMSWVSWVVFEGAVFGNNYTLM